MSTHAPVEQTAAGLAVLPVELRLGLAAVFLGAALLSGRGQLALAWSILAAIILSPVIWIIYALFLYVPLAAVQLPEHFRLPFNRPVHCPRETEVPT